MNRTATTALPMMPSCCGCMPRAGAWRT